MTLAARPVGSSALLTDLYQLTMLDAYVDRGMQDDAVFEFFVRKLPATRNFLVAAGLEQLLDYLESLAFTSAELAWLESTGRFSRRLIDYLADFRFTGEVRAMPEGTVFFPNEPVVQVIAPLPEAQLVETRLINLLHFQTMVASKAARSVLAAPGKLLVDFGLRRAHGAEAGLLAARAAYLAGFAGTSTVLANAAFGIPIYGTMAHSFVQAHESETDAFEHFARLHPEGTILLIDTYDTLEGARKVAGLAARLREDGVRIAGVRLDSGDLAALAPAVRRILDDAGLHEVTLFLSGSLDEHALAGGLAAVPAAGYGIGTRLDVSADAPYLDCVYKIEEYAGRARRKRSTGKETWPGQKQVYRQFDLDGRMTGDLLVEAGEAPGGQPLLATVMVDGRRISPSPALGAIREHTAAQLAALGNALRDVGRPAQYPVTVSDRLRELAREVDRRES